MAKGKKVAPIKNHLRAWREFREMTQEALAERAGTSKGQISDLENNKRRLSDKWAHKLAPLLRTRPGHLLDHDPNEMDTRVLEAWADIADDDRPQVLTILETFRKKR